MKKKSFVIILIVLAVHYAVLGQVSISGLTCVVSGGEVGYLYTATGNQQANDQLTWKITGGVIQGTVNTSFTSTLSASGAEVRVIWNKGVTTGKIKLTNGRLGVSETTVTIIDYPNTISVANAQITPGSTVTINGAGMASNVCIPLSNCWWEVASANSGPFNEIDNATSKNLSLTATLGKKYYRRVVSINGNVLYSNIISIDPQ
jgi:hypothetical protein